MTDIDLVRVPVTSFLGAGWRHGPWRVRVHVGAHIAFELRTEHRVTLELRDGWRWRMVQESRYSGTAEGMRAATDTANELMRFAMEQ